MIDVCYCLNNHTRRYNEAAKFLGHMLILAPEAEKSELHEKIAQSYVCSFCSILQSVKMLRFSVSFHASTLINHTYQ